MANIYVTSLYYWGNPTEKEREILKETYELSRDSYLKNLEGIDEHILFTNPGIDGEQKGGNPPFGDVFYDMYLKTHELWKQGHNIFYADIDTICIHPIKIFGEFDKFTLFNGVPNIEVWDMPFSETKHYLPLMTGKSITSKGIISVPTYFNDGVRYFPTSASESIWEIGTQEWEVWKSISDFWGMQQIIHNKMFYEGEDWKNDYTLSNRPDLNFFNHDGYKSHKMHHLQHSMLDNPPEFFEDYHIYHLFSSRGLKNCLMAMKKVQEMGI